MQLLLSNITTWEVGRTQSCDLNETYSYIGHKIKVTIHHDTSYVNQSWAKVEVLDREGLKWNLLDTHHYSFWAKTTPRTRTSVGTPGMFQARDFLLKAAEVIL